MTINSGSQLLALNVIETPNEEILIEGSGKRSLQFLKG
jgi:hypothetical protein